MQHILEKMENLFFFNKPKLPHSQICISLAIYISMI
jgi:hypothetical protein